MSSNTTGSSPWGGLRGLNLHESLARVLTPFQNVSAYSPPAAAAAAAAGTALPNTANAAAAAAHHHNNNNNNSGGGGGGGDATAAGSNNNNNGNNKDNTANFFFSSLHHRVLSSTCRDFYDVLVDGRSATGSSALGTAASVWTRSNALHSANKDHNNNNSKESQVGVYGTRAAVLDRSLLVVFYSLHCLLSSRQAMRAERQRYVRVTSPQPPSSSSSSGAAAAGAAAAAGVNHTATDAASAANNNSNNNTTTTTTTTASTPSGGNITGVMPSLHIPEVVLLIAESPEQAAALHRLLLSRMPPASVHAAAAAAASHSNTNADNNTNNNSAGEQNGSEGAGNPSAGASNINNVVNGGSSSLAALLQVEAVLIADGDQPPLKPLTKQHQLNKEIIRQHMQSVAAAVKDAAAASLNANANNNNNNNNDNNNNTNNNNNSSSVGPVRPGAEAVVKGIPRGGYVWVTTLSSIERWNLPNMCYSPWYRETHGIGGVANGSSGSGSGGANNTSNNNNNNKGRNGSGNNSNSSGGGKTFSTLPYMLEKGDLPLIHVAAVVAQDVYASMYGTGQPPASSSSSSSWGGHSNNTTSNAITSFLAAAAAGSAHHLSHRVGTTTGGGSVNRSAALHELLRSVRTAATHYEPFFSNPTFPLLANSVAALAAAAAAASPPSSSSTPGAGAGAAFPKAPASGSGAAAGGSAGGGSPSPSPSSPNSAVASAYDACREPFGAAAALHAQPHVMLLVLGPLLSLPASDRVRLLSRRRRRYYPLLPLQHVPSVAAALINRCQHPHLTPSSSLSSSAATAAGNSINGNNSSGNSAAAASGGGGGGSGVHPSLLLPSQCAVRCVNIMSLNDADKLAQLQELLTRCCQHQPAPTGTTAGARAEGIVTSTSLSTSNEDGCAAAAACVTYRRVLLLVRLSQMAEVQRAIGRWGLFGVPPGASASAAAASSSATTTTTITATAWGNSEKATRNAHATGGGRVYFADPSLSAEQLEKILLAFTSDPAAESGGSGATPAVPPPPPTQLLVAPDTFTGVDLMDVDLVVQYSPPAIPPSEAQVQQTPQTPQTHHGIAAGITAANSQNNINNNSNNSNNIASSADAAAISAAIMADVRSSAASNSNYASPVVNFLHSHSAGRPVSAEVAAALAGAAWKSFLSVLHTTVDGELEMLRSLCSNRHNSVENIQNRMAQLNGGLACPYPPAHSFCHGSVPLTAASLAALGGGGTATATATPASSPSPTSVSTAWGATAAATTGSGNNTNNSNNNNTSSSLAVRRPVTLLCLAEPAELPFAARAMAQYLYSGGGGALPACLRCPLPHGPPDPEAAAFHKSCNNLVCNTAAVSPSHNNNSNSNNNNNSASSQNVSSPMSAVVADVSQAALVPSALLHSSSALAPLPFLNISPQHPLFLTLVTGEPVTTVAAARTGAGLPTGGVSTLPLPSPSSALPAAVVAGPAAGGSAHITTTTNNSNDTTAGSAGGAQWCGLEPPVTLRKVLDAKMAKEKHTQQRLVASEPIFKADPAAMRVAMPYRLVPFASASGKSIHNNNNTNSSANAAGSHRASPASAGAAARAGGAASGSGNNNTSNNNNSNSKKDNISSNNNNSNSKGGKGTQQTAATAVTAAAAAKTASADTNSNKSPTTQNNNNNSDGANASENHSGGEKKKKKKDFFKNKKEKAKEQKQAAAAAAAGGGGNNNNSNNNNNNTNNSAASAVSSLAAMGISVKRK